MAPEKERMDWFVNKLDTVFGMKSCVKNRYEDRDYSILITYYSPTMIELGTTSFSVDNICGDILFGFNTGMFMSNSISMLMNKIRDEYRQLFDYK